MKEKFANFEGMHTFLSDRSDRGELKRTEVLSAWGTFTTCTTLMWGLCSVILGFEGSNIPLTASGFGTLAGSAWTYWKIGIPNTKRTDFLRERLDVISGSDNRHAI